jgi:CRP/FNR family cyclic AMP-dependent transcriptional regulator
MKTKMIEISGRDLPQTCGTGSFSGAENVSASAQLCNLIAQQPFFKGLNDRQLQLLAAAAMEKQFAPGEWIFRQGDPANRFYLILEGKVLIESEVKNGGTIPVRRLGPGEDLGWAWLFPPYYMHFSAQAIEPTKAIFFYATHLREQCEENHEFGYQLMRRIADAVMQNFDATQQRLQECSDFESFSWPGETLVRTGAN